MKHHSIGRKTAAVLFCALMIGLTGCQGIVGSLIPGSSSQGAVSDPSSNVTSSGETSSAGTSTSSQPTSSQETSSQPVSSQPVSSQPVSSQPVSSQPVSSTPVSSKPASSQGTASVPTSSQPVSSKPVTSQPASTSSKPQTTTPIRNLTLEQETTPSGHYNNTVATFNSAYVTVCGDYALEIVGGGGKGVKDAYGNAVLSLANKYPSLKVACLIVPKSSAFNHPSQYANQFTVQQNSITSSYSRFDGSNVVTVDAFGEMAQHKGEYMYYRTDHHWNSLGAYYASVAFCKAMGFEPLALNTYKTVTTSGYIGSMYNFCANPKPACLRTNPDLTIARLPQSTYTMTYVNGGVSYKGSAINANSAGYMMFMCGDQPFTHIKTDNTTGRSLLIFKESYGNAFAPYMIDYYDQVVVVDNRYNTKSVAAIIQEYGITDALIINNIQASNDSNQINWLKKQIAS